MTYRYRNLSHAIDDPASPLREYFHRRFPNVRPVQDGYRQASGPIVVEGVTASPGTVAAAFDLLLRFRLDAGYRPRVAAAAEAISAVPEHVATVSDVAAVAGAAVRPSSDGDIESAVAVRACWALALTTELYRNPLLVLGSPPAALIRDGEFTTEALLALAPDDVVELLGALYTRAVTALADVLAGPHDAVALGPAFAGSRWCAADADVIVDGTLIDVKTRMGNRNKKSGVRSDSLPRNDIYQLLGYVLFDRPDEYRLTEVAVYSARYATLHRWPLQQLLDTLAGEPVDLAAERAAVWELLGAQDDDAGAVVEPSPSAVPAPETAADPEDVSAPAEAVVADSEDVSALSDAVVADPEDVSAPSGAVVADPEDASAPSEAVVTGGAEPDGRRGWQRLVQWRGRLFARRGRS
ncbi:hypothetical protein [Nocardia aurantia]|uniref:hypothetical protein n=1 Tax=Nocardia aurantia TaxID=2585199 RepID=UPI0012963ECC|nr:hypothetical protein [Nocardia aurantia]